MADLTSILDRHVRSGSLPGAVGLVARAGQTEVAAVGAASVGGAPMARDSIFRLASITKPITAAALMILVDEGRLALGDPVGEWLPELAEPSVVRTPASEVDDVVPATRPITVFDLLTSRAGYGFASDFTLPAVQRLFTVQKDGREVQSFPAPDVWMAELSRIPLLYQPGEAWLYDTCSTVQGVLIARVSGQSLPEFMAERVFGPLGMADSAFEVPAGKARPVHQLLPDRPGRRPGAGRRAGRAVEHAAGLPAGERRAGRHRRRLAGVRPDAAGRRRHPRGRRLLSAEAVRLMTTDHTTAAQREIGALFLEGQGWGFGGSVDIAPLDPWNIPGRYGWVGGTGTSAHIVPSTGTVAILLAQVAADSPVPPEWMRDFWRYAASVA